MIYYKKNVLFIIVSFFLVSCASKSNINLSVGINQAVENVALNTPSLCQYKGKVGVKYKDITQDASFNALLDKKCDNDINIVVLGLLNSVVAKIHYKDDNLTIDAEEETKKQIEGLALFYSQLMARFLKSPLILPNYNFKLSTDGKSYIFYNGKGIEIYADENFIINKYVIQNIVIRYFWNNKYISKAEIEDGNNKITLNFANVSSWKGNINE